MSTDRRPNQHYEKRLAREGFTCIAGVGEVGRGAWAGPLVAAAVVLPLRPRIHGIDDSKQLTRLQRERAAQKIIARAVCYAVGVVSHEELDSIGVAAANALAMVRAVEGLSTQPDHVLPDYVLIDAFTLRALHIPQASIKHGDALIYSIAAASIIAKVHRDKLMNEYHEQFPQYGFHSNKGYGTAAHQKALATHGLTPVHRMSFQPMKTMV